MTRRQTDMESLRRECKSKFRNSQAERCTYCGQNIIHDMARHVSNYHLDLEQLWRCPVSWCSQWKGTPRTASTISARDTTWVSQVKTANLGKWFPPWTVTRSTWNTVLKPNVLGISTDVVLFSEHGPSWSTTIGGFGDGVSHGSLCGPFMIELSYFTNQACAEARSVAKRTTYDDPPARKAARAVTYATQDESSPVGTSTAVSVAQYSAPRFATQDVTPDNAQSLSVATQLYPSSPGSWSSTPCFDLADFDSECFRVAMSSPGCHVQLPGVRRCAGRTGGLAIRCCVFRYVYYYEPVLTTQHPGSPVSMMSVNQVVAESPTSNDAPVVPLDISPVADHLVTLNPQESQVSRLSSVQLSPNRVQEDFDFDMLDIFPMFPVSLRTDGYLPCVSPVSSLVSPAVGSLLDMRRLGRCLLQTRQRTCQCRHFVRCTDTPSSAFGMCVISFGSSRRRCTEATSTSGINTDGGHGPLASPGWPGRSTDTVHHDGD